MVKGRCLTAKKAKIHEFVTITDFRKKKPCSESRAGGTKKILLFNKSGQKFDIKINGRKIVAEVSVEKKSTGRTALSLRDSFLNTS